MFGYFKTYSEHIEAFDLWMRRRRAGITSEWYDIYPVQFQFVFGSDQGNESVFLVDVAGGRVGVMIFEA